MAEAGGNPIDFNSLCNEVSKNLNTDERLLNII